jgi:dGTPase
MATLMEWQKLLLQERFGDPEYVQEPHRPLYVQDADRISFSAPFRRLANKTQVHPLYENDHIHHRLIHSVETSSVGRSLGMSVGHWLEETQRVDIGAKHIIAGTVQAACLAHDIGNPPFGHSGEAAIGTWFEDRFANRQGLFGEIDSNKWLEFENFEGNAQGLRLLTRLEMYFNDGGMRLSHAVLGAFQKYPGTAQTLESVRAELQKPYCGAKKFGVFEAEYEAFTIIAEKCGLIQVDFGKQIWWRRHPLVFLVEAADDICYNILDLEDAFTANDLSFDRVIELMEPICGKPNRDLGSASTSELISYYRARSIGSAIAACVDAFKDNYEEIMSGEFSTSLVEESTKADEFATIKDVMKREIFSAKRKTELEVGGRNVIRKTMDGLYPVFEDLAHCKWEPAKLTNYNQKVVRALNIDLRLAKSPYDALHCFSDFVSGMTDRYAVHISKMLSGIE